MQRQTGSQNGITVSAVDCTTPGIDPISNPGWNSGVTKVAPVVVRLQMLISFGLRKRGGPDSNKESTYGVYIYAYPVVTLWNPYNVRMEVRQWSLYLHTLPLEHTIYKNDTKINIPCEQPLSNGNYTWEWGSTQKGYTQLGFGTETPGITLAPGEARILTYKRSEYAYGVHNYHHMVAGVIPWLPPDHVGHERFLETTITGKNTDRIAIETRHATFNSRGTEVSWAKSTFEFRCKPRANWNLSTPDRFDKQSFDAQVGWIHEDGNPVTDTISKKNFPNRTLRELDNAPMPFLHLDCRLKTLDEIKLPDKTWLHNIPSLPFAAATSTALHRSSGVDAATTFFAHPYTVSFEQKLASEGLFQIIPYFGSSNTPAGQTYITDREVPLVPLSSLAQLQNLPQSPIEALNWSGYYLQNHAIGNSYASPGLPANQIKLKSFPFHLGNGIQTDSGDLAGQTYNQLWFNNADYVIAGAPASIIDRSYAANHLLWDDYFFSSMAAQDGTYYKSNGQSRSLRAVVEQFHGGIRDLPNASYRPYLPAGLTKDKAIDSLVNSAGSVARDASTRAAAQLMVAGGFNVNSTSVPAWTVMLAAAHLKRPVILDATGKGKLTLQAQPEGRFVVSRFTVPNGGAASGSAADENLRWRGYRELTEKEIGQLAEAIVRQVKQRGPFRSLGEFINRRLGDSYDEKSLCGALQAALDDPAVDINKNYRTKEIDPARIAAANYPFRQAALGSRYQGTPAYISQADLLMSLAPMIQARSDTFLIRGYGESRSADGKQVLARAWCEAVVQRNPDFLDPVDPPETPVANLKSTANKTFGRRFTIKLFRWLSPGKS